jgi:hypothetical protein
MRRRHRLIPACALAAAAVALLAAGCGGGSSPGVARVGRSTTTASSSASSSGPPTAAQIRRDQEDAVRFTHCMRSHGVASFPDATVAPRAFKNAFDNPAPGFQSAYSVCGHLLPAGHAQNQSPAHTRAQTAALLAFARCMRSHGYPSFPDPTSAGQVTREMLARVGIDLHATAAVRTADGCAGVTHGVITRALIARFVAGQ